MLGLGHVVDLLQNVGQTKCQSGDGLGLATVVDLLGQAVAQRGKGGQPVTGLRDTNETQWSTRFTFPLRV